MKMACFYCNNDSSFYFFYGNPRLVPGPNLVPASTNRDLCLYPEVYFSCIVTNLHLSVIENQDC